MKTAHRWYSVFRNVGWWTIGVVIVDLPIWFFMGDVRQAIVLPWLLGLELLLLPILGVWGVWVPYRSDEPLTTARTTFGWLVGGLFGLVVFFVTASTFNVTINQPYYSEEQLYAIASRSLDRVSDQKVFEENIARALKAEVGILFRLSFGNEHKAYPELSDFCRRLHRRGIGVSVHSDDNLMLIVRIGNHRKYFWIGLHERWKSPPSLPPTAKEITPCAIFSNTLLP